MKRWIFAAAILTALMSTTGKAQYTDDALRLSTEGTGVGARALGMGGAYTGVASDYSAIFWNPAGLSQAVRAEFSLGLSYLNNGNTGTFFNTPDQYTVNGTTLNSLGLVFPIPVRRGGAAIAFGYDRENSFTNGLSFNGFNPNSSIVQTYAQNRDTVLPGDPESNLAYQLFLADSVAGRWLSPIVGGVQQSGKITESGGLNNWSVGGAVDVGKDLSLGVTVTYVSGSYRYDRTYTETDPTGTYANMPLSTYKTFNNLTLKDFIQDDIAGWNAKFGLMYRVPDKFRLGITIKTPTAFNIRETYGTSGTSTLDGNVMNTFDPGSSYTEYDVTTPWVFGAGASLIIHDLVLSGDVDYTDWTQMEFSNASQQVMDLNATIKSIYRGTFNYRAGAEYEFQPIGLRLRGGFMYNTSPYQGDPSTFDQKYVTGGLGFPLGETTMIDLALVHGWWNTYNYNYDPTSRVDEKLTVNNVLVTLSHRF